MLASSWFPPFPNTNNVVCTSDNIISSRQMITNNKQNIYSRVCWWRHCCRTLYMSLKTQKILQFLLSSLYFSEKNHIYVLKNKIPSPNVIKIFIGKLTSVRNFYWVNMNNSVVKRSEDLNINKMQKLPFISIRNINPYFYSENLEAE